MRLLGQSPAGLSATGESDTRNYYDMIAARQELELRPALERLDRVIAASEGIDPGALDFAFRPLWQLDAASAATIALQKAQATQVYAGLKLWPAAVTARLVEAQLAEDGTYPNARAVFGEKAGTESTPASDARQTTDAFPVGSGLPHYAFEPRDWHGRWTAGEGTSKTDIKPILPIVEIEEPDPDPTEEQKEEELNELLKKQERLPNPLRVGIDPDGKLRIPVWPGEKAGSSGAPQPPSGQIARPKLFTPAENAGLTELFRGGGSEGSVVGARRLLDQISRDEVELPLGVTRDVLERYRDVARKAIAEGKDKLGVQELLLRALDQLIER